MITTFAAAISGLILMAIPPVPTGDVAPPTPRSAGLLGLVRVGDSWVSADTIVAREREDARLAAIRAEYADRRATTAGTANSQRSLALWCESVGLRFESLAHFEAVARLDPDDTDAHSRLGQRRYRGRWMTESEAARELAEARSQKEAEERWTPKLVALRAALVEPKTEADASRELLEIRDPRAFTAIRRVFGNQLAWDQRWAIRVLAQIDSDRSTRELAWLSVFGIDETVRIAALKVLDRRDPRAFVAQAIRWLRDPVRYRVENAGGDAALTLMIEGPTSIVERRYTPTTAGRATIGNRPDANTEASRKAVKDRREADVRVIQQANNSIDLTDARVERTLFRATGIDLGQDSQAWNQWWSDEQGYSYQSPAPTIKPIRVEEVQVTYISPPPPIPVQAVGRVHHSCFGAGTVVLSRNGPTSIEDLRVGDQVLTQDTVSATVDFRPILAVFHNKPASTLRIKLDGETVVVTPIHRFWLVGKGWAMARDLKPGDRVRKLGGTSEVTSVNRDEVQPVFNLEVAGGHSFFVGRGKVLVHDNSAVLPVAVPFDR